MNHCLKYMWMTHVHVEHTATVGTLLMSNNRLSVIRVVNKGQTDEMK